MTHNTKDLLNRKILISNIQKYNMYDGPGIRTMIFFQGCPLRCLWCSNPETLEYRPGVIVKHSACTDCGDCIPACPIGIHNMDKQDGKHHIDSGLECLTQCNSCETACKSNALATYGKLMSIKEIMAIIEEDRIFYELSGGGVTLSGGDPLLQYENARDLLKVCKESILNTAIETSGFTKQDHILQVAQYTDLFLFDIKQMDPIKHKHYTGVDNTIILDNLKTLLQKGYNVRVRMPILHGINDDAQEIDSVINFLSPYFHLDNFKGIDLLPYHKMGINKYNQIGRDYPLAHHPDPSMPHDAMQNIADRFKNRGIVPINVVNH